jgi:aminoglycoside 3-N-acetyltransferase
MSDYSYDYDDLIKAYSSLGVSCGSVVYVVSSLRSLGSYAIPSQTLDAHYRAIKKLIGNEGTIIVPTATLNLCNTDIPFNIDSTRSYQMGAFSEYIRNKKESHRSNHPFWSLSALGECSEELTRNVSKHTFAHDSVWNRMVDKKNVIMLHIGLHPGRSLSIIHYAERLIGVPYRYTKEFIHPIVENNSVVHKEFYMDVMYKNANILWDRRKEGIVKDMLKRGLIMEHKMPTGCIWSSNMTNVLNYILDIMSSNFYTFLEKPPSSRPYQR